MKIEEVSIVDEPANKSARVVSMTIDGKMRDTLSWREEPDRDLEKPNK